jgi:hypothetical protein
MIGDNTERKDIGDTKEEGAEGGAFATVRKVSEAIQNEKVERWEHISTNGEEDRGHTKQEATEGGRTRGNTERKDRGHTKQ